MALTAIDPNTALIVIDLQKGIVGFSAAHSIDGVIERSRALADAFRARGMPVVLVNVTGTAPGRTEQPRRDMRDLPVDFAELVTELGRQPDDILVTKRSWGAFANTDLEAQLKALGVITGVATGTGVEATARQAYEQASTSRLRSMR